MHSDWSVIDGRSRLGLRLDQAEKEAAWAFLAFVNQPTQNATGYLPILNSTPDQPEAKERLDTIPAYSVAIK